MNLTVPSQVGQSLDGKGVLRSTVDGRCTNSARFSAIASATHSAVAFSPLQKNKNTQIYIYIYIYSTLNILDNSIEKLQHVHVKQVSFPTIKGQPNKFFCPMTYMF